MLPVVRGERATVRRIVGYTVALVALHRRARSRLGAFGLVYLGSCARARRCCSSRSRCGCGAASRPAPGGARVPLLAALPRAALRRSRARRGALGARAGRDRRRSSRGARRARPTDAPARARARGRRCGTTHPGSPKREGRLPAGASPVIGAGLAAPGNAGVIAERSLDDGARVPGAAPVLAVDDDPPTERDRHEQLAASVSVEVEAVVGTAEPGEERQVDDAVRRVPREEPVRLGLSRQLRFVRRGRPPRQQTRRGRDRRRTQDHNAARCVHDRGRYLGGGKHVRNPRSGASPDLCVQPIPDRLATSWSLTRRRWTMD